MLPQSFRTIPPALLWRQSPKKLVIGRRSSVQSGILSLWITWSCSPFYTLLIFITLQPLELPFLPFLCLMFCLSIFVSFSFSQSSCVAPMLQCFNLYFYPLFTPPLFDFFLSPSQMGVYILPCRRWQVTLARSAVLLAPRNSWRRRMCGCWVSRRGEPCRNYKGLG